jgi:hypothetical protein
MEEEKWKDFEFKDAKYKISSFGKIYSYASQSFIKEHLSKDGYPQVTIGGKKKRSTCRVHRLVAIYFVENPKPDEYNEVNHIDFDRTNYKSENLEWCTHLQNIAYSVAAKRMYCQANDVTGKNNHNYGNKKLSKIYANDKKLAKEKQGRPGAKNGRCVKVAMFTYDKSFYKEFNYIRECADYMIESNIITSNRDMVANNISNCIVKKQESYLNYYFEAI